LKKLDFSCCGLTKLPKNLGDCHELQELNLSNNCLSHSDVSTLIRRLGDKLRELDLSCCGLTQLPKDLDGCYKLEKLNLSNNHLRYFDSFTLSALPRYYRLKKLDLSGCGLKAWPLYLLQECVNLQELNLSNNSHTHQNLLKILGVVFRRSQISNPTKIIFEDAVYTQINGG
jgi:Leucine-rich repeat (LRR) protein